LKLRLFRSIVARERRRLYRCDQELSSLESLFSEAGS